jgi:hypothetical protein
VEQCCRGGGGVVLAAGSRHLAVARGAEDLAVFEVSAQWVGVDLGVVAVAQQRERHASVAQRPLGVPVLSGQRAGRIISVEHARVQDARDPGRPGGLDDVGVLGDQLAHLAAGDQQEAVHAGQRRAQGLRAGIVRLAHLHAHGGQARGLALGAHQGDDAGGGHAAG